MDRQFVVSAKILPLLAPKAYCGALQSIAFHRKFKARDKSCTAWNSDYLYE